MGWESDVVCFGIVNFRIVSVSSGKSYDAIKPLDFSTDTTVLEECFPVALVEGGLYLWKLIL